MIKYITLRFHKKFIAFVLYFQRRLHAFLNNSFSLKLGLHTTSTIIGFNHLEFPPDSIPVLKSFSSSLGCYYQANGGISIGANTKWGPRVSFISESYHTEDTSTTYQKRIIIGSSVWIGANVVIMPGV